MKTTIIEREGVEIPIGTHEKKCVVLGADHGGFAFKGELKEWLIRKGYAVEDHGTQSPARCDYPPIADSVGRSISESDWTRVGILICRSGGGMLIPALKHRHVYGVVCGSVEEAEHARRHNNANLLSLSGDKLSSDAAKRIVRAWLSTPFYAKSSEEAYLRRFLQTAELEEEIFGESIDKKT